MSYIQDALYGSLYLYGYTTALVTSGGGYVKIIGFSAGDSYNTTVSTSNNNITINQTQEVKITFNSCFGYNSGSSGPYQYLFGIYINGTIYNPSLAVQSGNHPWGAGLNEISLSCIYAATNGDIIDIRAECATATTAANPVFYLANLSIQGVR